MSSAGQALKEKCADLSFRNRQSAILVTHGRKGLDPRVPVGSIDLCFREVGRSFPVF